MAGGRVGTYEFGPKGRSVAYQGEQDTDNANELYRADLKTGVVTKLNGPLVADGSVHQFGVVGN